MQQQPEMEEHGGLGELLLCPITQEIMTDPVVAADGHSYERAAIAQWIATRGARALSPMTGERLVHLELQDNFVLRSVIGHAQQSSHARSQRQLTQQDLLLAIQLREQELNAQLEKQAQQIQQEQHEKASVVQKLGPLAQQQRQLSQQNIELTREIEQLKLEAGASQHQPLKNHQLTGRLGEVLTQTRQLESLEEQYLANVLKRILNQQQIAKTLGRTQLEQRREQIAHQLELNRHQMEAGQGQLQQAYQKEQATAETQLQEKLAAIKQQLVEHADEEGDDDAALLLINQRKQLRAEHELQQQKIQAEHETQQAELTAKCSAQQVQLVEQRNQINAAKASKRRDLIKLTAMTERLTVALETQKGQLLAVTNDLKQSKAQITTTLDELCEVSEQRYRPGFFEKADRNQGANKQVQAQVSAAETAELLTYVVRGNLDNVERLLKANPSLAYAEGDITDLSDRTFLRITAFQYAVWALDKPMWELILPFLPQEAAAVQLRALEESRPDITHQHGAHFSFDDVIAQYREHLNKYEDWSDEQRKAHWCKKIGGAQRQYPAWLIMMMMSEEEIDVAWFKKDPTLRSTRDHVSLEHWYRPPPPREANGVLGAGKWAWARWGRMCGFIPGDAGPVTGESWDNIAVLSIVLETRSADLAALKNQLDGANILSSSSQK